jgi:hypothetical protein
MKRERFTEEQIIGSMSSVRRRRAASTEATFDKWESKFGRREISESKRLKALDNPPKREPDRRRREKDVGDLRSPRTVHERFGRAADVWIASAPVGNFAHCCGVSSYRGAAGRPLSVGVARHFAHHEGTRGQQCGYYFDLYLGPASADSFRDRSRSRFGRLCPT